MRIVITGASGFIAGALFSRLSAYYELTLLSRHPQMADKLFGGSFRVVQWDGKNCGDWVNEINGAYAVINLAGENIAGRWNNAKKKRILHSRLDSANVINDAILQVPTKPKVLIQASATGYYGSWGMLDLDETSKQGTGFLADICYQTETVVSGLRIEDMRTVIMRTGIVLGAEKGALPRLLFPFKFYLGGYPGSGTQYISWITITDLVEAIKFIIEGQNLQGVFNLTSPLPVTMKELCIEIGKILNKPCWLAVPSFILKLALGEMAEEVLLTSQKVIPRRLLEAGFKFKYPDIAGALKSVLLNLQSENRSV